MKFPLTMCKIYLQVSQQRQFCTDLYWHWGHFVDHLHKKKVIHGYQKSERKEQHAIIQNLHF
jgi:hypothetical protein